MKRLVVIYLATVISFFLLCGVSFAAEETTRIISGYQTGEFAYKGEVEKTGNDIIAEIKSISDDGENIIIRIEGFADVAGKTAGNDALARLRAEAVSEEFRYQLHRAQISIVSKGDSQNVREAHATFYRVAPAVPAVQEVASVVAKTEAQSLVNSQTIATAGGAFAFVVIAAVIFLFCARRRRMIAIEHNSVAESNNDVFDAEIVEWRPQRLLTTRRRQVFVTIEIEGKKYNFFTYENPDHKVEALHVNKIGNLESFHTIPDLCRSVRSTLKKQPELVEQLLASGRLVLA